MMIAQLSRALAMAAIDVRIRFRIRTARNEPGRHLLVQPGWVNAEKRDKATPDSYSAQD
jgi:hypothetical protein